jgi:hypothetical protein
LLVRHSAVIAASQTKPITAGNRRRAKTRQLANKVAFLIELNASGLLGQITPILEVRPSGIWCGKTVMRGTPPGKADKI